MSRFWGKLKTATYTADIVTRHLWFIIYTGVKHRNYLGIAKTLRRFADQFENAEALKDAD